MASKQAPIGTLGGSCAIPWKKYAENVLSHEHEVLNALSLGP
jgi:hypothetical protein